MGAREEADDAVVAETVAAETFNGEEDLPALAVGAGVPVVCARAAAAEEGPFGGDDEGEGEDGLEEDDGRGDCYEEGEDEEGAVPSGAEGVEVGGCGFGEDLDGGDGGDIPVYGDEDVGEG